MRRLFYAFAMTAGSIALISAFSMHWNEEDGASLKARRSTVENVSLEVVRIKKGHVASLRLNNHSQSTFLRSVDGTYPHYRLRKQNFMVWRELDTSHFCGTEFRSQKLPSGQSCEFDVDLSHFESRPLGPGCFQIGIVCIPFDESKSALASRDQFWTAWSPPIWSE